jgi:DNA primase
LDIFCLFHNDQKTPNLAVYFDGGFNCFCCDTKGGDVLAFQQKVTDNAFPEVLIELAEKYLPELLRKNTAPSKKKQLIATYSYKDEKGDLLYQVLRYDPKDFPHRQPDGNGGWK